MTTKHVEPSISLISFSCPRCGALAHQDWFSVGAKPLEKNTIPFILTDAKRAEWIDKFTQDTEATEEEEKAFSKGFDKRVAGEIELVEAGEHQPNWLTNVSVSQCYSCNQLTLWRHDKIVYPPVRYAEEPNQDMPEDIQLDFNEARALLDLSPRGSAALLRLCVQKLCTVLGTTDQNLNNAIAELVGKGLPDQIKKALDVVRVIGNDAVHPGQLDLRDNRDIAAKLFTLVNMITYQMITQPKELEKLHSLIPEAKLQQIEKRDQKAKGSK